MKVQSQYFLDPEIKGHQIDVDTNNGVVMLKGTVASDALKQQAERIARDTEGVARVVNQLTVKNH
jgi:hyperosmotically inducible protein